MDGEQHLGRLGDHVKVIPLDEGEFAIAEQLGGSDHAVERGANLVAHVCEELALGAVRLRRPPLPLA